MKRLRIVILCLFAASAFVASGKGVLPCMVYRYGLTNEQIDDILTQHPDAQLRITAQDWRGIRYELSRFQCMTNYVNLIGSTQDCARVLLQLHDTAEDWRSRHGAISNLYAMASRELDVAMERANEYATAYTSATNAYADLDAQYRQSVENWGNVLHGLVEDYNAATNSLAVAEARASLAETKAARLDRLKTWLIEQRDKAMLSTTKALYQAILDRLEEN